MKKKEIICLKVLVGINIIGGLLICGISLWKNQPYRLFDGIPCFVYAILLIAFILAKKETAKHEAMGATFYALCKTMAHDLSRYETLYGKLPKEEPKQETNESERTDESKD